MVPRTPLFVALLTGCAANTVATGSDDFEVKDAGRRDASVRGDAGQRDASVTKDASTGPCASADAPHGCFTLVDTSAAGCPEQAPEIPSGIPAITGWDLCNNLAVSAGATCTWKGPAGIGGTAMCSCVNGLYWSCVYD